MDKRGLNKNIFLVILVLLSFVTILFVSSFQITTFDNGLTSENLTFTENQNITRNLTLNRYANVTSAFMNLSGYTMNYYLDTFPSGYTGSPITNGTSIWSVNIRGQNISVLDKTIDKMGWYWKCLETTCDGNISYRVRYVNNKSILAECFYGSANQSTLAWRDCDFINFNTGSNSLIYTIEIENSSVYVSGNKYVVVYGEGASAGQNANGNNDFWGNQWYYYMSRTPPEWEWYTDPYNTGGYYNINITFTDGTNYAYPNNPYLLINNSQIWNHIGEFNETFSSNKTDDFSGLIENVLNSGSCNCINCFLNGSSCTIPFIFHSDTAGILQYSAIDININPLSVYGLTQLYSNNTVKVFGFFIQNLNSTTMNNVTWKFNTGTQNITSQYASNLSAGDSKYVVFEYNYSSPGTYNVIATAFGGDGSISDSETIQVTV